MHIPEDVVVEIVDPTNGKQLKAAELGEIVATTFNKAYPLIRYGTPVIFHSILTSLAPVVANQEGCYA